MKSKKYEAPSMKVSKFYSEDVVCASGDKTPRFVKGEDAERNIQVQYSSFTW